MFTKRGAHLGGNTEQAAAAFRGVSPRTLLVILVSVWVPCWASVIPCLGKRVGFLLDKASVKPFWSKVHGPSSTPWAQVNSFIPGAAHGHCAAEFHGDFAPAGEADPDELAPLRTEQVLYVHLRPELGRALG